MTKRLDLRFGWPVLFLICSPVKAQVQSDYRLPESIEENLTLRFEPACDPGPTDEIRVCARAQARSPYRIAPTPGWSADGPAPSLSRERHSLYEQGDSGIGSCSNVGPGGWTGCMARRWKQAREQHNK